MITGVGLTFIRSINNIDITARSGLRISPTFCTLPIVFIKG